MLYYITLLMLQMDIIINYYNNKNIQDPPMFNWKNIFPEFLYCPAELTSKGAPPTALFKPSAALSSSASPWQSATTPRSEPQKKKIVLTLDSFAYDATHSKWYAACLFLMRAGFSVYFYQETEPWKYSLKPLNIDTDVTTWLEQLDFLASPDDQIYEISAHFGIAKDQLCIINKSNADNLLSQLYQNTLPYSNILSVTPCSVKFKIESQEEPADLKQWLSHWKAHPENFGAETKPFFFMLEAGLALEILDNTLTLSQLMNTDKVDNTPFTEILFSLVDLNSLQSEEYNTIFLSGLLTQRPEIATKINSDCLKNLSGNNIQRIQLVKKHPEILEKLLNLAPDLELQMFDRIDHALFLCAMIKENGPLSNQNAIDFLDSCPDAVII